MSDFQKYRLKTDFENQAQKNPPGKLTGKLLCCPESYSSSEMHSTGQTSAHEPQSVQRSASIT